MKIIRLSIFILFLLTFTWSCQDDTQTPQLNESLTVEKARMWFENSISNTNISNIFRVKSSDSTVFDLTPQFNWDLAELDNDSIWSVVELPWEYENGKLTMTTTETSDYCQSNRTDPEQILHLVILKNRITGSMYGFKMAIIPDLNYMLSKGDEFISSNFYLNRDSRLSGLVLFYSVNDEFVNGWKYKDGKVDGIVELYNPKLNSRMQKISINGNIAVIETCNYWSTEIAGYISYHHDCESSYFFITGGDGSYTGSNSNNGGSNDGFYDTNHGPGVDNTTVVYDCFNVPNGTAYPDLHCGGCVGGTTGKLPCIQDCAGVWGGKAFWDITSSTCIKPADPCAEIDKIKADAALINRLHNYIDKAKNDLVEDGYMMKVGGGFLSPTIRKPGSLRFEFLSNEKFSEHVHLHQDVSGGTYVFSGTDLMTLYSTYINHRMENPATFKYIVVSSFGIGSLNITDPKAFTDFGNNYNKAKLDKLYRDTPRSGNEMKDYLKQFLDILKNTNSGLTFSLGEFDMGSSNPIIEWNTKQHDSSGNVTNKNCNQ